MSGSRQGPFDSKCIERFSAAAGFMVGGYAGAKVGINLGVNLGLTIASKLLAHSLESEDPGELDQAVTMAINVLEMCAAIGCFAGVYFGATTGVNLASKALAFFKPASQEHQEHNENKDHVAEHRLAFNN